MGFWDIKVNQFSRAMSICVALFARADSRNAFSQGVISMKNFGVEASDTVTLSMMAKAEAIAKKRYDFSEKNTAARLQMFFARQRLV